MPSKFWARYTLTLVRAVVEFLSSFFRRNVVAGWTYWKSQKCLALVLASHTILTLLQSCLRSSAILGLPFNLKKSFWRESLCTLQILKSKRQPLPKVIAARMNFYFCVACINNDQMFSLSDGCLVTEWSNSAWNLVCSKLWSYLHFSQLVWKKMRPLWR